MAMFAQTLRRSLLETRSAMLQPTLLVPLRAHITTVSQTTDAGNMPNPLLQSTQPISQTIQETRPTASKPAPSASAPPKRIPHARDETTNTLLTPSIRTLLPLLTSQPSHYLTIHIHGHPYLITRGDTIRLPFLMPKVAPGDVLRLNRATHIGSRDYTLKAPEAQKGTRDGPKKVFYLDERLFVCRATVLGVESEPLRIMEKTKRRRRHVRHVRSQHRYTVLRISDVQVRGLEEYEGLVGEE